MTDEQVAIDPEAGSCRSLLWSWSICGRGSSWEPDEKVALWALCPSSAFFVRIEETFATDVDLSVWGLPVLTYEDDCRVGQDL